MGRQSGLNQRRFPGWLLPALGYLLSAASLIWVFHDFDVKKTLEDFASLDWRYVTIAVIFDLAVYLAHAWRWKILLSPVSPASFWRTAQAIYIGLYANEILPLRTGEVIRCYLQAHWNKLSMSLALSSAVIERILDGVWLVTAMYITTRFVPLAGYLLYVTQLLAAITCALLALLAFIVFYKQRAHVVFSESRWMRGLKHVIDGIHTMGARRTMLGALGASFVYLALQVVPVWALMEGYGLNLSIWAAVAVLIIMRVGTAIPSAPGNAGLLQLFCVLGLRLFDVPEATAKGFSLMMFGVLTLPLLFGGFIAVALTGLKLDEIRSRAASATAEPAIEVER
jgi:uncharacterized protein (TIRG00374 family)